MLFEILFNFASALCEQLQSRLDYYTPLLHKYYAMALGF